MTELTHLEKTVVQMLLEGEDAALALLRTQFANASVRSRKMTGVGFFSEFALPENTVRIPGEPSFKIGDVNGTAANVKHGLGFLLYIADGALKALEGYTYDEPWPKEIENLKLSYTKGRTRDLLSVTDTIQHGLHNPKTK
jgi:hypothetical protein